MAGLVIANVSAAASSTIGVARFDGRVNPRRFVRADVSRTMKKKTTRASAARRRRETVSLSKGVSGVVSHSNGWMVSRRYDGVFSCNASPTSNDSADDGDNEGECGNDH